MIDLAMILKRIETRLAETGMTAAEVSAKATDSKDTIRNWARAVEADQKNGTRKASATTIKLNQVEEVLGVELAQNATGDAVSNLRSALTAYGVHPDDMTRIIKVIDGFVDDVDDDERELSDRAQPEPANHRREPAPKGKRVPQSSS